MNIITSITEKFKTAGRVLFNGLVTGTADIKGILPKASNSVSIVSIITMANAADLVLTVKTADDADGLNAVDLAGEAVIYKDDVRQADGITLTVGDDAATVVVVFNVSSILVPDDKFLCLDFGISNDANIISSLAFEDSYYEGDLA